jgi:AcrR family transcriptional regulator
MSEPEDAKTATLWERTREGVREHVRRVALGLFLESGFEAITAADIAVAAGISQRSFFRYFSTKDDVLISGSVDLGARVRDALVERPLEESTWASLRAALAPLAASTVTDRQRSLDMLRVIMSTATLRARHLEKHLAWEQLLSPVVAERLGGSSLAHSSARTACHLALASLDVALDRWVESDGRKDLDTLLDDVFAEAAALSP